MTAVEEPIALRQQLFLLIALLITAILASGFSCNGGEEPTATPITMPTDIPTATPVTTLPTETPSSNQIGIPQPTTPSTAMTEPTVSPILENGSAVLQKFPDDPPRKFVTGLLDDFGMSASDANFQPAWNRVGGSLGEVLTPGAGQITWSNNGVDLEIDDPRDGFVGIWEGLSNGPADDVEPLNLGGIWRHVRPKLNTEVTEFLVEAQGTGTLKLELKSSDDSVIWSDSKTLTSEISKLSYPLPQEARVTASTIVFLLEGQSGDRASLNRIEMILDTPDLDFIQELTLYRFGALTNLIMGDSGFVRDKSSDATVSSIAVNGLTALALSYGFNLNLTTEQDATTLLQQMVQAYSTVDSCESIFAHFIGPNGRRAGTSEFSTVDTAILDLAISIGAGRLGIDIEPVVDTAGSRKWDPLVDGNGAVSHGYDSSCSRPLSSSWTSGGEALVVNSMYAVAATGELPPARLRIDHTNGRNALFINALVPLLMGQHADAGVDINGIDWVETFKADVEAQIEYLVEFPSTGYSAGEMPQSIGGDYRALGLGRFSQNPFSGSEVILTPHAFSMMLLSPDHANSAIQLWADLSQTPYLSPMNIVESAVIGPGYSIEPEAVNSLHGGLNLALSTLSLMATSKLYTVREDLPEAWSDLLGRLIFSPAGPTAGVASGPELSEKVIEAESGSGGKVMPRSNSSDSKNVWIIPGQTLDITFDNSSAKADVVRFELIVSDDGGGSELEIQVGTPDGVFLGLAYVPIPDTREPNAEPGTGWNEPVKLTAGMSRRASYFSTGVNIIRIKVTGEGNGTEIDQIILFLNKK